MTKQRDLKRLVRERQARTGESYVTALRQLRSVLLTTTPDPAFDLMRAVVLHGERPSGAPPPLAEGLKFLVRLRAGIGGVCPSGRIVSFAVAGPSGVEQVVFLVWLSPLRVSRFPPTLIVTSADSSLGDLDDDIAMLPFSYFAWAR